MPSDIEIMDIRRATSREQRRRFQSFIVDKALNERDGRFEWLRDEMHAEIRLHRVFRSLHPDVDLATHLGQALYRSCGLPDLSAWEFKLWSLAQHYDIATGLLDMTYSINVAAWFATNAFDMRRPQPAHGEHGVMYRCDLHGIRRIMSAYTEAVVAECDARGEVLAMAPFVQGIDDIPEACALRPLRQHGLSVYGFDQFTVLHQVAVRGAIEAFVFPHGAESQRPVPSLTREDLCPATDPFLSVVKEYYERCGSGSG